MNDLARRLTRRALPWLCVSLIAACAAPQAPAPPPPVAAKAGPPRPSAAPGSVVEHQVLQSAEELSSFALVRDQPAIAAATAGLAASAPSARPAALMNRARASFADAGKLLAAVGGSFVITSGPAELTLFLAYCELALRDLREVLAVYPGSPEAPEAMFLVGRINDYPNLNQFATAVEVYRLTIERYPGTTWAIQAGDRIRIIEEYGGPIGGSPHRQGGSAPSSAPPPPQPSPGRGRD